MIVHIRGSLGTQVIQLMGWMAYAIETGHTIQEVHINVKGTQYHSQVDYVSQIFKVCPPTKIVHDIKKVKMDIPFIQTLMSYRRLALEKLQPIPMIPHEHDIIHVRWGDRRPTKLQNYRDWWMNHDWDGRLIGDDHVVLCELEDSLGAYYCPGSPVYDWNLARSAKRVVGGISTFTLSAFLVNPTMELHLLPHDGPARIPPAEIETLNWLMAKCKNLRWAE